MSTPNGFSVAVVGGGICGAALAASLSKAGVRVDLYESAKQFEEVGAGIGLGVNALKALDELGILDVVNARSGEPAQKTFRFLSGQGDHHLIHDYPPTDASDGLGIHRATLLNAIVSLLDPATIHFGKRCIRISASPTSHVSLIHFADGTTVEADVVVGADGIRSLIRDTFFADGSKHMVFTNTTAARGLIPTDKLIQAGVKANLTDRPACFVGPNRHIITFPINHGKIINIVVFRSDSTVPMGAVKITPPWVRALPHEDLMKDYEGSGSDVIKMLECLENPKQWFIHALHPPLPSFVKGTVILIGDAAHGMLPHLGAGAGQGIEDVFSLAKLLSHPQTNATNLVDVALAYDNIRVTRANTILEKSAAAGKVYDSWGVSSEEDIERGVTDQWHYIWDHDIRKDVESAVDRLTNKGVFK